MEQLVDTGWLAARLTDPDLRILECTVYLDRTPNGTSLAPRSGRAEWTAGHIPGSDFADLVTELSDPDGEFRFTMPTPERFAAAMERLGVGDGTSVVLYDRSSSMWATRVWWMLRTFGFDEAAVLDGGWHGWMRGGRPVSSEPPPARPAARFTPRPRPGLIAGKDDVVRAMTDGSTCIVNALSAAQHRGEEAGYPRPGHIPGAANVPARSLLDPATQRFLPQTELERLFAGIAEMSEVVTYCGGGIAATADAFALTLLGHRNVSVYDGSLLEWASDPALPLEVGD
jgi:thiosulfate/3-mercaptopyruvate sulfurtransferase